MPKTKSRASFAARTRNIYRHQAERAGGCLPCTLEQLREVVKAAFMTGCPYCGGSISVANFSIDHVTPITRGGTFHLTNIVVADLRCNKIKGQMTPEEFVALTGGAGLL